MKIAYPFLLLAIAILLTYILVPDSIVLSEFNLEKRLLPPSFEHILGTDTFGRDLFLVLVIGFRNSIALALASVSISAFLGSILGIIAAVSKEVMYLLDHLMILMNVIPPIFVVAVITIAYGAGFYSIVLAAILTITPLFYRIVKTASITVLAQPYVEALKALGASSTYILTNCILKEVKQYIFTLSLFSIPTVIAIEMSLNFLGFGLRPSIPLLGNIIAEGIKYFTKAPHLLIIPVSIIVLVTSMLSIIATHYQNDARQQIQ